MIPWTRKKRAPFRRGTARTLDVRAPRVDEAIGKALNRGHDDLRRAHDQSARCAQRVPRPDGVVEAVGQLHGEDEAEREQEADKPFPQVVLERRAFRDALRLY